MDSFSASISSRPRKPLLSTPPFPRVHFRTTGSKCSAPAGAALSLRDSYRIDLRAVRDITNFEYIRFHDILDDDIGVYDEDAQGKPIYNFSYVDQIYDGLLENKVKPFVELSFMPRKLALNAAPHAFWYKPLPSPPRDSAKWGALIEAFTNHLIARYGKDEVETWYFEVWNEPNIDFWNGNPKQQTYFDLYDVTAKAIKKVDAKLRIGGPATAQARLGQRLYRTLHAKQDAIRFCFNACLRQRHRAGRFRHQRENSTPRHGGARRQKGVRPGKNLTAPNTPIIWSEYNATYMNQQEVTDSAFMGPWLANKFASAMDLVTSWPIGVSQMSSMSKAW